MDSHPARSRPTSAIDASSAQVPSAKEVPTPLRSDPHDREVMLRDVLEGLSLSQKEISPKYFYDARGSLLFEEITGLEEYYLTRTERVLLQRWMPAWVGSRRPRALVELGAGSARKSRIVLDAMEATGCGDLFVPVDVSGDFLHETAAALRAEYRGMRVEPAVADMSAPLDLPPGLPEPAWYALLGSTLGNFDSATATTLLRRIASRLRPRDCFLLGIDLRPSAHKTVERLERAYNDGRGVTAEFNLNVLRVLNRELGSDFDPAAYRHRAFYAAAEGRIEMHLVADRPQMVRFPRAASVPIEVGESIRTEISCKYDRPAVEALFADAGLSMDQWVEDDEHLFALALAGTGG